MTSCAKVFVIDKVFKMTPLVFLFALTLGHVTAGVVQLSCSDNATCIENMLRETARSLRQQKTVRLFDALTIEPLNTRQGRASDAPLTRFTKNHAFSFDWNDYTFRVTRPSNNDDVMDLEVYQSRSAKGESINLKELNVEEFIKYKTLYNDVDTQCVTDLQN